MSMMKPTAKPGTNPAMLTKPQYNKVDSPNTTGPLGQPSLLTNSLITSGLPAQTINTAVTANPHHFQPGPVTQTQSAFQNGVGGASDGHVMKPKSHDPQVSQSQEEQTSQNNLANTKEKTPMCLINELARFNKVTHQYTLVDEQGPAHKKNFYVKLQIGEKEEYSASGPSIKKAQHAAASIALEKTEFKHPPPKVPRNYMNPDMMQSEVLEGTGDGVNSVTPTVELNTLAMKRGEPAIYKSLENRNPHPIYYPHNYDFRGMYNQRYHYMKPPRIYYVSLKVGTREFIGEGNSRQMARHCAASKALEILRSLPMPDGKTEKTQATEETAEAKKAEDKEDGDDKSKSEISVVHELALRLNLPVTFEVTKESGPPHMKNFVTVCTVGSLQTEADGNSKKLSKKRAAELMLAELRKLPQLPSLAMRPKTKPGVNKKKNRNLIKMQKGDPTYGVGINPISRLIQIQQAQKKKEPVYTLLAERGMPRRREFVMQVMVDDQTCTGVGPNKKLAKRHAAEAMLLHLGYNKPSPQPTKPAIKSATETGNGEKKVHFVENSEESGPTAGGAGNRQMVPGLLVLPEANRANINSYSQLKGMSGQFNSGATLLNAAGFGMRPELKLKEVAARYNIEVKFDEFAGKNNTNEYLSRVVVASNPQHTLHGSGPTPEASRDAASLTALKILKEMGVIKEEKPVLSGDGWGIKEEKPMAGGDGSRMKNTVG